jgi:hypothetical protein
LSIIYIMNHQLQYAIKNGYYIPPIHACLYAITGDAFLSTTIAMKIYPANYFYWFGEYYDFNIPKKYNWVKQFVRFTDTGYLASILYIVRPEFLPITYNVHFVITFGYWLGKLSFNLQHNLLELPDLNKTFELTWAGFNHGLSFAILNYRMLTDDMCYEYFTFQDMKWSYYWMYIWFFAIYLPWRFTTGDCVYSIFATETSWKKKGLFLGIMHIMVALGNSIGKQLVR